MEERILDGLITMNMQQHRGKKYVHKMRHINAKLIITILGVIGYVLFAIITIPKTNNNYTFVYSGLCCVIFALRFTTSLIANLLAKRRGRKKPFPKWYNMF